MLYNCYAAPFIFLVTGLPLEFRKWLVTTGIHKVDSHLNLLLIENGVPVTHDYLVTLTNYNLRTETDGLRRLAHKQVIGSVLVLLFDKTSDTTNRIASFINKYRDNIDNSLLKDEACLLICNSLQVSSLEVTVPKTKITTTVYNIYIHPPTTKPIPLMLWRWFIAGQRYYADKYGVGVKYQYPWRCIHCKSTDHLAGLCPLTRRVREGRETPHDTPALDDDLLPPPPEPTPGPSNCPQNPNHGKRMNAKGRNTAPGTQQKGKKPDPQPKGNAICTAGPKKRKVH